MMGPEMKLDFGVQPQCVGRHIAARLSYQPTSLMSWEAGC